MSDLFNEEQAHPLIDERETPIVEPLQVTVIPISITNGSDPWAELRKKYGVQTRSRRKKTAYPETIPSLWTVAEGSIEPTLTKPDQPDQQSLW